MARFQRSNNHRGILHPYGWRCCITECMDRISPWGLPTKPTRHLHIDPQCVRTKTQKRKDSIFVSQRKAEHLHMGSVNAENSTYFNPFKAPRVNYGDMWSSSNFWVCRWSLYGTICFSMLYKMKPVIIENTKHQIGIKYLNYILRG